MNGLWPKNVLQHWSLHFVLAATSDPDGVSRVVLLVQVALVDEVEVAAAQQLLGKAVEE